jgi:hypothetical protein
LIVVKHTRFNFAVVLVLLTAFLLVQADLPVSQAAFIQPSAARQCCCSPEKRKHGTCCCCSMGGQAKSGCSLRASRCGESEPSNDTVITVKFQIVLPMLAVALLHDIAEKPAPPAAIDAVARSIKPSVPPPRLLLPV